LGYNQKGVVVRTGITSGIDVFFGNGVYGKVPETGAIILCEYIVSDGIDGNLDMDYVNNTTDAWRFSSNGLLDDSTEVSLNDNFSLKLETDAIFGA
jgi:hypothetical protein